MYLLHWHVEYVTLTELPRQKHVTIPTIETI